MCRKLRTAKGWNDLNLLCLHTGEAAAHLLVVSPPQCQLHAVCHNVVKLTHAHLSEQVTKNPFLLVRVLLTNYGFDQQRLIVCFSPVGCGV